MAIQTVMTATTMCSFGTAPSTLMTLPISMGFLGGKPVASIMDHKPFLNILPFAMCTTPSNPMVAAATAAALGVLTPMPCIPVTTSPWIPGSPTVMVGKMPALNNNCKCMCNWGGIIQIVQPGQFQVMAP